MQKLLNLLRRCSPLRIRYLKPAILLPVVFSLLFSLPASSQDLSAKKINVQISGASIKDALQEIQKQSGIKFIHGQDINKYAAVKVTMNGTGISVKQAIQLVLKNTNLRYTQKSDHVMIDEKPATIAPASKKDPGKITGKVIDEGNGQPVAGATIRIGNNGTITNIDGSFTISLPKGNYAAIVSYLGYGTKEVNEIDVEDNKVFPLNITLKREKGNLAGIVVTASAKKEGVAALYAAQKNRASISDGISAEQMAKTPDNNIGQVLKRVSGVSTIDNRYVVVRGLTERYNQAMLDGIIIPSTDMNRRNFSFDIVPTELISNVVVNKTATPEGSSEFSGGQITVNTLDIPVSNFNSITIGAGYNSRTTGKEFIQLGGRGNTDYLGFDDGRRDFPKNIRSWDQHNDPVPDYALAQSKQFNSDQLKIYRNNAAPNQNYRLALGRIYNLQNNRKFGFAAGLTYRNTQETSNYLTLRNSGYIGYESPNNMDSANIRGYGNQYKFATTLGGVLNAGMEGKKYKISLKNYYSRLFNEVSQKARRTEQDGDQRYDEYLDIPEITAVLQNKLDGEYNLGQKGLKLNWSGAVTTVQQQIKDLRRLAYEKTATIGGKVYFESPQLSTWSTSDGAYASRLSTNLKETDYNWSVSVAQPFKFLRDQSLVKIGYTGWQKHRTLGANKVRIIKQDANVDVNGFYETILAPERMGITGDSAFYYAESGTNGEQYDGKAKYHSGFLMLDQHYKKFRLVYGVRAENFNMANDQLQFKRTPNDLFGSDSKVDPFITGEKNWRFLPSVNLTYSLTGKMNLRAAYSTTMVRPDFRETAYFQLYDVYLDAYVSGWNVVSTKINNIDFRYEWYPSPGEIISVSGFYKHFDKPLELQALNVTGGSGKTRYLRFQNQKDATNTGVELEFRKSLGFIAPNKWLRNITLFGNGTLTWSEVTAVDYSVVSINNGQAYELVAKDIPGIKRPLYGQSPWIVNAGIEYNAKVFGTTISYNRAGARSYVVDVNPNYIEFENGRNMLDIQLVARLLKQRGEIKLNVSNLLDEAIVFYQNRAAYTNSLLPDGNFKWDRTNGTDAYERDKGDEQTYRIQNGRTANLSFTYRF